MGLGAAAGLPEALRSDLGIVVTELTTNVVRHGGGGEIIMRPLEPAHGVGVEVLGLDRGPGMPNVADCLRDGFSSAGSMGTGLGAMQRIAADFDIYSAPGLGTAVAVRIRSAPRRGAADGGPPAVGVCVPKPGETVSGDGWSAVTAGGRTAVCVVDGLGHGPAAAEAADQARVVFGRTATGTPTDILDALNRALRSTRGAAVAVAIADASAGTVRFGGIGNIGAMILTPSGLRTMVSHNGIVGHQMRRVQEFEYPWAPGATMVLHSDGLTSHWRPDTYPGVLQHDPVVLCGLLYRDHARGRDDVTVVACRSPFIR